MVNKCYNILIIQSCIKSMEEFNNDNTINNILSFNILMPLYNYSINHRWGCYSDALDCVINKSKNEFKYAFYTHFDPPLLWIKEMSRRYDDILFKLHAEEPLMNYYNDYIYYNNELIYNSNNEYYKSKFDELHCDTIVNNLVDYYKATYSNYLNDIDIVNIFNEQSHVYIDLLKRIDEVKYNTLVSYIMRKVFDKLIFN